MIRSLLVLTMLFAITGCARRNNNSLPPRRMEPTPTDRVILRLDGIRDPYSREGQRRIWKLAKNREEIEEIRRRSDELLQSSPRSR